MMDRVEESRRMLFQAIEDYKASQYKRTKKHPLSKKDIIKILKWKQVTK
jgi:hypothetical protein